MRTILAVLFVTACAGSQLSATTRNEAMERYARGQTLDQIARELHLADRDAARAAVRDGMMAVSKRYYRER